MLPNTHENIDKESDETREMVVQSNFDTAIREKERKINELFM